MFLRVSIKNNKCHNVVFTFTRAMALTTITPCRCCNVTSWDINHGILSRQDMCESCAFALSKMHQWLVPMGAPPKENGVPMEDFKAPEFSACNQYAQACNVFEAWQKWPKKSRTIKCIGISDRFAPEGQLYDCYATSLVLCLKLQLDGALVLADVSNLLEKNSHGHGHIFDMNLWIEILGREKIIELSSRFSRLDTDVREDVLKKLFGKYLPIDEDINFVAKKKEKGRNPKHLHKEIYKGVLWSSRLLCDLFGADIVDTTSRDLEHAIKNISRVATERGINDVLGGVFVDQNDKRAPMGCLSLSPAREGLKRRTLGSVTNLTDFDDCDMADIDIAQWINDIGVNFEDAVSPTAWKDLQMQLETPGEAFDDENQIKRPRKTTNAEQKEEGINLRDGIVFINGVPQDHNLMNYLNNTWHLEQIVDVLFIDKTHVFKCENAQDVCETMSQEFYNTETGCFRDDKFVKWILSHVMGWTELSKDHGKRGFAHSIWHYVGSQLITVK